MSKRRKKTTGGPRSKKHRKHLRNGPDPEVTGFMLNPPKAKVPFDSDKAFKLMEELSEAFNSNNEDRFGEIKKKLEDMGCKVRMKPAPEHFGVIFPPEFL